MYPVLEQKIASASSGEELTQLFRSLSFEGLGHYAHKRMKEAVTDLSDDKILKVLSGEKTFSGNIDDMSIINETNEISAKFNKDLSYICRGLIRHTDGKLYRPYAYVADYCDFDLLCTKRQQEIANETFKLSDNYDESDHKALLSQDIKRTLKITDSLVDIVSQNPERRVMHYANDNNDLALFIQGNIPEIQIGPRIGILLKEITDEPPAFFNGIHSTADEAFAQMIEKHSFEIKKYGYRTSYTGLFGHVTQNIHDFTEPMLDKVKLWSDWDQANDNFFKVFEDDYYNKTQKTVLSRSMLDSIGWLELKDNNDNVLAKIPKLPFLYWALERADRADKLPQYSPVSSIGLKTSNDDRYHSDWMIGGGLSLMDDYGHNSKIQNSASKAAQNIQINELDFESMVLSKGNIVTGPVKYCTKDNASDINNGDIIIIPNGKADYQLHVQKAFNGGGGVITLMPNRVAHLVKVSKEMGITMMLKTDALEEIPEGSIVTLNPNNGTIKLNSVT